MTTKSILSKKSSFDILSKEKGKKTKKVSFSLIPNKLSRNETKSSEKQKKSNKNKKQKVIIKNKKGEIVKKIVVNPLCDTCLIVDNNMGSMFSNNEEDWKDFPFSLPILGRKVGDQSIDVDLGKKYKNRLIYYFASRPSKMQITNLFPDAYKNSNNNGLLLLDNFGKGKIYMDCPLHYKEQDNQGYVSHVHIIVSDSKMGKWEDVMFTQSVLCKIQKYQYNYHKVRNNRVIINAIDKKYNLPGTYGNINYKKAKEMTPSQIRHKVKSIIEKSPLSNCKKINKSHNIIDTPLLVYCHNIKCNAAKELVTSLYKAGFYNILYYDGGFLDYHNRNK